jgi:putative ABC transport system permease protein
MAPARAARSVRALEPSRPEQLGDPECAVAALLAEVRRAVRSVDPELAIHHVANMRDIIQRSMTLERAASVLTTFFALAALLLTTLAVYGVVSYFVRHRRAKSGRG